MADLLALLPLELLQRIMETSQDPTQAYIQLLSLSHGIRTSVWGTPRELSFVDDDHDDDAASAPRLTADALAALLGPCKSLVKLSFGFSLYSFPPTVFGCGRTEAAFAGWVDEAFGSHGLLEVLENFPTTLEPIILRILLHLSGLLELRVGRMSDNLLPAIARCCPRLQMLQLDDLGVREAPDITALEPLNGSLQHLILRRTFSALDAFVGGLSALRTLHLYGSCPTAALGALDPHLTSLSLEACAVTLPKLTRLECLSLRRSSVSREELVQLLAANRATLQQLELSFGDDPLLDPSFAGVLDALPRLTDLEIVCSDLQYEGNTLSTELIDRLEHLALGMGDDVQSGDDGWQPCTLCFASHRLRSLDLEWMKDAKTLTVECPNLVELRLPSFDMDLGPPQLSLNCPRLRLIEGVPDWFKSFTSPVPDLEMVRCADGGVDPDWLRNLMLREESPRLWGITGLSLGNSKLVTLLCTCGSLVALGLDNPDDSGRERSRDAPEVAVFDLEAPRLRSLSISGFLCFAIRLHCPSLATLSVSGGDRNALIELDEQGQLRGLDIRGAFAANSLLGLLTRHGARLHHNALGQMISSITEAMAGTASAACSRPRASPPLS
ncbi:hypothetical protein PAPYR_6698 [Paratrimastix pyriformis]|uniref:F-box domain-containing protein n=1 Tax=Paratrimastix pyriformis TaxID=342808 RepID=A0ABQ8UEQ0_9EUKA|nr:hypothetical protein PAPYR_6698 [Paratrimastix pyriformis]